MSRWTQSLWIFVSNKSVLERINRRGPQQQVGSRLHLLGVCQSQPPQCLSNDSMYRGRQDTRVGPINWTPFCQGWSNLLLLNSQPIAGRTYILSSTNKIQTVLNWKEIPLEKKLRVTSDFWNGLWPKHRNLKASYKQDFARCSSNTVSDFSRPAVYGWAWLAFEHCLTGYQRTSEIELWHSQIQTVRVISPWSQVCRCLQSYACKW